MDKELLTIFLTRYRKASGAEDIAMLEKHGITQEQADKLATQNKDMFLITYSHIYQFVYSNAQGRAYLADNVINTPKGLCKRGHSIIADAATVNKTVGYNVVFEG